MALIDYPKEQETYLRKTLGNKIYNYLEARVAFKELDKAMQKIAYPWITIGYRFKDVKFEPFKEIIMPSEDKQILFHRIAKMIIKLTYKYHKKERDIVGELYENSVAIDQLIGQEMERIKLREKGEI